MGILLRMHLKNFTSILIQPSKKIIFKTQLQIPNGCFNQPAATNWRKHPTCHTNTQLQSRPESVLTKFKSDRSFSWPTDPISGENLTTQLLIQFCKDFEILNTLKRWQYFGEPNKHIL